MKEDSQGQASNVRPATQVNTAGPRICHSPVPLGSEPFNSYYVAWTEHTDLSPKLLFDLITMPIKRHIKTYQKYKSKKVKTLNIPN